MVASLWALALAFGWIEASVVVYLRATLGLDVGLDPALPVTVIAVPERLVPTELAREAATIVLLGAAAVLAVRRPLDRFAAFLVLFGVWDLAYYAVLWLILGWPQTPGAWDVLFLIPVPWVAPVWAPATVAAIFVVGGSHVLWTEERSRPYGTRDVAVMVVAALLILASFLVEWRAPIERRVPDRFAALPFWAGVALGVAWFARLEWRAWRRGR
jgi:hypothetical protein